MALAHERRAPVLFHAGRGIPHLGEAVVDLARRYPGARLILAHAGISDLGWIADDAAALRQPVLRHRLVERRRPAAALRDDPARADPLRQRHALRARAARRPSSSCAWRARSATVPTSCARSPAAQLARVVAGEDPARRSGPRPGPDAVGRRVIEAERVVTYCAAGPAGRLPRHGPVRADRPGAAGVPDVPRRRRPRAADATSTRCWPSARRAPPRTPRCPSRSCPRRCWRWSSRAPRRRGCRPSLCDARHRSRRKTGYGHELLFVPPSGLHRGDRRCRVGAQRRRSDGHRSPRSMPCAAGG